MTIFYYKVSIFINYACRIFTVLIGKHFNLFQIGTTIAQLSIRSKKLAKMIGVNYNFSHYSSMSYTRNDTFLTLNGFKKNDCVEHQPDFWTRKQL